MNKYVCVCVCVCVFGLSTVADFLIRGLIRSSVTGSMNRPVQVFQTRPVYRSSLWGNPIMIPSWYTIRQLDMWLCCQRVLLCVCLKALDYSHVCGLSLALCSASRTHLAMLQVMFLWPNAHALNQIAPSEELLAAVDVFHMWWPAKKSDWSCPCWPSEIKLFSLFPWLTTLKAFIYQLAPSMVTFLYYSPRIDGDEQMLHSVPYQVFFESTCPFSGHLHLPLMDLYNKLPGTTFHIYQATRLKLN